MEQEKVTAYEVPPVRRAIAVLKYIGAGNTCANISKSTKELGINRTTLIRLLHTLREERMIEERDENTGFRLGLGLIGLATESMNGRDVIQIGRPRLAALAEKTGLSAHLGVLDGHDVVYLVRESPNAQLVSNVRQGTRLPAHATTMGRILLAHLPEAEVRALYEGEPMPGFSAKTATSFEALTAQIAADRAAGIAWSAANFEEGIGSCACAVFDHRGRPVAAINVSGPDRIFRQGDEARERIGDAVKATARDISERLGHAPAWPGARRRKAAGSKSGRAPLHEARPSCRCGRSGGPIRPSRRRPSPAWRRRRCTRRWPRRRRCCGTSAAGRPASSGDRGGRVRPRRPCRSLPSRR